MMRGLGRLIRSKEQAFISTNKIISSSSSDPFSINTNFNSFRFTPCLHFSRWSNFIGENLKNMCHRVDGERKGGFSSNLSVLMKTFRKMKELLRGLREGDTVDLNDLLFTKDRDYLIKCNGGQQVKAEQLEGKVVVIYFDSAFNIDLKCLKSLTYIYNDLKPKNGFEVVFVDTSDSDLSGLLGIIREEARGVPFENVFPKMPWLAIPFSDITSRKHLKQKFLPERIFFPFGYHFVIGPTGIILHWWWGRDIFREYGAAGYPFDKHRLNLLKSKDDEAVKSPSLNALLASCERDYLIRNNGERVPIDPLEDKVVALLFYIDCDIHQNLAAKLKVAYEELKRKDEKFEVVLIYIYDSLSTYRYTSEDTFSNTFNTMPWLALPFRDSPFRDSTYKKLERLFSVQWEYNYDEKDYGYGLVIIGPHMRFIQPFGHTILDMFGVQAYPFTYQKVAELATEEAKKLELKMLWDPNSVLDRRYGAKVELSHYVRERVIVLFDWYGVEREDVVEFIETLKKRYNELQNTDDRFKVIHITTAFATTKHVKDLPWDTVPVHDYTDDPKLFEIYGESENLSLLAFDRDGRIVRKTIYPTLEDKDFPFYSGDLEKEALSQLYTVFEWFRFAESQAYQGTIYSCKQAKCF